MGCRVYLRVLLLALTVGYVWSNEGLCAYENPVNGGSGTGAGSCESFAAAGTMPHTDVCVPECDHGYTLGPPETHDDKTDCVGGVVRPATCVPWSLCGFCEAKMKKRGYAMHCHPVLDAEGGYSLYQKNDSSFYFPPVVGYSGRYVKLTNQNPEHMNLAELEVFGLGGTTNLAFGKTVTMFSVWPGYGGSFLVDGDVDTYALSQHMGSGEWMLLDLGSVQEIGTIKIENRRDHGQTRAVGIKALILAADVTTVVTETPAVSVVAVTYTFIFPGTDWA